MASSWRIEQADKKQTAAPRDEVHARNRQMPKRWPGYVLNQCQDKVRDITENLGYPEEDIAEILGALKLTDNREPNREYTLHGVKSSPKS